MSDTVTLTLTLDQLKDTVRQAVREELLSAGLRVDDSTQVFEAREDFRFLRRIRKASDRASGRVGAAVIVTFTGLVLGALWLGFKDMVKQ